MQTIDCGTLDVHGSESTMKTAFLYIVKDQHVDRIECDQLIGLFCNR